jgi:hypothetical protein
MQSVRNRWARAAFIGVGVLIILFALVFPDWARRSVKQDRENAPPRQGTATVAMVVDTKPSVTGTPSPREVLVRFQGQIYAAKTIQDFDTLKVDHPAQIVYRVGRSGRVYVDSVAPLPSAPAASNRPN